jgi:release factor glutamine methyltransferase
MHTHCFTDYRDIAAAWAGGKRGRQVIDRFLPQAAALLSQQGAFYIVVVQENRPNEIITILEGLGLSGQVQ